MSDMEEQNDNQSSEPLTDEHLIGKVLPGTITHVANFGAFVKLDVGEEGLVHISEIANEYVTDINQFVTVGQKITIKVLARNKKNKLEFSMKKATEPEDKIVAAPVRKKIVKNNDFETKISSFLKRSEEKQIDVRRNLKNKQGLLKKRK
jgi:S1 RNA binding domain protein